MWSSRGYIHEGRRGLEELLTRAPEASIAFRARALYNLHDFARILGDSAQARAFGDEGLAAYRAVGDPSPADHVCWSTLDGGETNVPRSQMMGKEALALAREAGSALATALALGMLGAMAAVSNDWVGAETYYEESLALGRMVGDRTTLAGTLKDFGTLAMIRGAYEQAETLLDECLTLEREMGRSVGLLLTLANVGEAAFYRGDHERAASLLDESMTLSREIGDRTHLISTLEVRGRMALLQGNYAQAAALIEQGMLLARVSEDRYYLGMHLTGLGNVAIVQGDFARAIALHRKSLALFLDMRLPNGSTERLEGLALALGAHGETARAAWLLGAAEAARERYGTPLPPPSRDFNNRIIATFCGDLSEQAWVAAWEAGQAITLEAAVSQVLEVCRDTGADENEGGARGARALQSA